MVRNTSYYGLDGQRPLHLSLKELSLSFLRRSFILWIKSRQTGIALFARYQSEKYSMQSTRVECSMDLVVRAVIFLTSGSSGDS